MVLQINNNKGNIKFINKNQEIIRIHSNKQVKSILKKLPDTVIKDYLEEKIKPTTEEAYSNISKSNLRATGEQLKWFYIERINIKKLIQ